MNRLFVMLCFSLVGGCAVRSQPAAYPLQDRVSALEEQNTKRTEDLGKLHTEIAELKQEVLNLELLNLSLIDSGLSDQSTPDFDLSCMTEIFSGGISSFGFWEPLRKICEDGTSSVRCPEDAPPMRKHCEDGSFQVNCTENSPTLQWGF